MSTTRSRKSKGKSFQNYVRDLLLHWNPELDQSELKSTTMGESGEDITCSDRISEEFFQKAYWECKHHKNLAWQTVFEEATEKALKKGKEPVVVAKGNYDRNPKAITRLRHYLTQCRTIYELRLEVEKLKKKLEAYNARQI